MGIVIRAEHLSKEYRLGVINHGMLYKDIQSWLARKTGRPDPHSRTGTEHFADQADRFWALKDLSFEIEQGDRIGVNGKNGAGKSTLLKILSRITSPTEGLVRIKGRVVSLLEVGTGFHPELTGRENIYLNGAILGMKRRQVRAKMDEIIDFSEIRQFIDTPVKRYSSGMYVRLAFAVAANLDSDILLADEVLAVGDAAFQKKCLGKMGDVSRDQGRTVIFVSHNMGSVSQLCQRGMILDRGALVYSGEISEVVKNYVTKGEHQGSNYFIEIPANEFTDYVRLRSFGIVNEDGAVPEGNLFQSKQYFLSIDIEIVRPAPNISLFWALFGEDGSMIFLSDIHDCGSQLRDELSNPGRKRLMSRLPGELLSDARYHIELSCVIHGIGWPLKPQYTEHLYFYFERDRDENPMKYDNCHPYTGAARPGQLSPVLPWTVENP